jgi:hypothetical protein
METLCKPAGHSFHERIEEELCYEVFFLIMIFFLKFGTCEYLYQ